MTDETTAGTLPAPAPTASTGSAANYMSLFAWPRTVQPGALNDNTNPLAYVHELFVLATTLEAGADPTRVNLLQDRRPDIASMPMDERSLKQTFPTLRFTIDRLEDAVRESATLSIRERVAQATLPTTLPFHFAWEQVKAVLTQRKLSIWDVVRKSDPDYPNFTFGNVTSPSLRAAMTLSSGFAPELRTLLTAESSTAAATARKLGKLTDLSRADSFRRRLGLSRKQLRQLLAVYQPGKTTATGTVDRQAAVTRSAYVTPDDADMTSADFGARFINDGGAPLYLRYESDDESKALRIEGLTDGHVDRIVRVMRLHHATRLSFADIDVLVATALHAEGQSTGLHLTDTTLRALGLFQHLREKYAVTASQFASFIGDIPAAAHGRERSFYDTLFNPSGIEPRSDSESVFRIDGAPFDHHGDAPEDALAVRQLSQALAADEMSVRWALDCVVKAQKLDTPTRSLAVVSACYRLIALPRALGLKRGDAPILLRALDGENKSILQQLAGVPSLNESTTGDEKLPEDEELPDDDEIPENDGPVSDDDTLKADVLDVIAVVMNAAEWAIQHKRPIGLVCLPLVAPEPTQPAKQWTDAVAHAVALAAAPENERLSDEAIARSAIQQGLQLKDQAMALPLLKWTNRSVGDFMGTMWALDAAGKPYSGTLDPALRLVADDRRFWPDLERHAAVVKLFGLSAAGLAAMVAHPTWFNLESEDEEEGNDGDMRPLDFTTIYQVSRYGDWLAAQPEGGTEDQAIAYFREVHENRHLTAKQCAEMLSRLTRWSTGAIESVASVIESKTTPNTAEDLRDVDFILRLQELSIASGLSVDALFDVNRLKLATDQAAFRTAAAAMVATCSEEDAGMVEGVHGEKWRDALVEWMLENWSQARPSRKHITDAEALSDHLLLDVMVGREPATSRIASAMASLQTYIHRILTGLEPGHESNPALTQEIRDTWNGSQSQYGRWRLLRQLKNYPENRIDPTRRSRKTSAFGDLQNLLAQGKFNGDDIQTAILSYLTTFEATSNIQPLTAYHDGVDPAHDTYHFIGKANVTPARYYWRTLDMSLRDADGAPSMLGWTAWEEITLPINGLIATTLLPTKDGPDVPGLPASTKIAIGEETRTSIDTIRPVVVDGRRYVVWVERDTTAVPIGSDRKNSDYFALRACYCYQQIDGLWGPPNVLIELNGTEGPENLMKTNPMPASSLGNATIVEGTCTSNVYLKTDKFSPGLVVMVNTSGYRRNDPWLTVLLFQANRGEKTAWTRDWNYYFASRDLLLLEPRHFDTQENGTILTKDANIPDVPMEDALLDDWMRLFKDPRVVQHQYAGKAMVLAEKKQPLDSYITKDANTAGLAARRYGLTADTLGVGSLDASMLEGKDFIEVRAAFAGKWPFDTTVTDETSWLFEQVTSSILFRITAKAHVEKITQDEDDVATDFRIEVLSGRSTVIHLQLAPTDSSESHSFATAIYPGVECVRTFKLAKKVLDSAQGLSLRILSIEGVGTEESRVRHDIVLRRKKTAASKTGIPSVGIPPTFGKARLVLRGGIDLSKARDISLPHEDKRTLAAMGLEGLLKYAQENPREFALIRAQLMIDPKTSNNYFYDLMKFQKGKPFGNYVRSSDCIARATHEGKHDVAMHYINYEATLFADAKIPVPAGVNITNAVLTKHFHADTWARFMMATQVEKDILAEIDVVLDGSRTSYPITARFPVNKDVSIYTFQFDVYSEDDSVAIGSVTRQYELKAKTASRWTGVAGNIDDAVPSTRLIHNRHQVHYLDLTEVNEKATAATDRLAYNAVRLNTLIGMRFAALATKSSRSVLDWDTQNLPSPRMEPGQPDGTIDFGGANGLYFWELFFHMPMLVAWQLRGTRQFPAAFDWCTQHLFDPYDSVGRSEAFMPPFWHSRPLATVKPALAIGANALTDDVDDLAYADPERYRKASFMFLVDAWRQEGDDFYRQLTRDDVNEAANCYRKALRLIGPLPEQLTIHSPALPTLAGTNDTDFLPPVNTALTEARDLLQNRLFNIRHGLTIDGKLMDLDLYDAADDFASLGNWRTGMVSGSKRMPRIEVPAYRFRHILPIAKDAVAQLIDMGRQVFHNYEEEYNAGLGVLQQANLIKLSDFTLRLEMQGLAAARAGRDTLLASRRMVDQRRAYYQGLDDQGHLDMEQAASGVASFAAGWKATAIPFNLHGGAPSVLPNVFGLANGGAKPGEVAKAIACACDFLAEIGILTAEELRWQSAFERDRAGWKNEVAQASSELAVIDRQLAEQEIQIRAAAITVDNEKARQAIMKEEYIFMTTGFAIGPTYVWMIAHLSDIYASAYDAVMSLCLAAQDGYRYETGEFSAKFIKPGAWIDNWRGMLAGDALQRDLLEMETAYGRRRERRMHIRKSISLIRHNTTTAATLCDEIEKNQSLTFSLPSSLYDGDFPGHYLRQIVSASVTFKMASSSEIQSIAALLTQTSNAILIKPDIEGARYIYDNSHADQLTVVSNLRHEQKVAVSATKPVIDIDGYSGLFSLVFGDDRYLPFEGTGAISTWTLSFPGDKDAVLATLRGNAGCLLEDILVTIDYTAADGGDTFAQQVRDLRSGVQKTAAPVVTPSGETEPGKPAVVAPLAAARVVAGSQGPSVSIAPRLSLATGATVTVTYAGPGGTTNTAVQPWAGAGLAIPISPAVLTANAGKRLTVTYTVNEAGKSVTSPPVVVTLPAAGASDEPAYPKPVAPDVRANNAIDRRDTPHGATVTIAPWAYIQAGQSVWLRCLGTKKDGSSLDLDLLVPPALLTDEQAQQGIAVTIPLAHLDALGDFSKIRIVMKASLDGSGDETRSTVFPELVLDIPRCTTIKVTSGEWANETYWRYAAIDSDTGFVATLAADGPLALVYEMGVWELSVPVTDTEGKGHRLRVDSRQLVYSPSGGGGKTRRFGTYRRAEDTVPNSYTSLGARYLAKSNAQLPPGKYTGRIVVQFIGWQVPWVRESIAIEVDVTQPDALVTPEPATTNTAQHPAKIRTSDAPDVYLDAAGNVSVLMMPGSTPDPQGTVSYDGRLWKQNAPMEKVWVSGKYKGDQLLARCVVPVDVVAKHVGCVIWFRSTLEELLQANGKPLRYSNSDARAITIVDPARLDLPTPAIPEARGNVLNRADVADGASVTVAPWAYIQEDQNVWVRCEGKKADGGRSDINLRLPPTTLTREEAAAGMGLKIPFTYLDALGKGAELTIAVKVGLDGSDEATARGLPLLTVTFA